MKTKYIILVEGQKKILAQQIEDALKDLRKDNPGTTIVVKEV